MTTENGVPEALRKGKVQKSEEKENNYLIAGVHLKLAKHQEEKNCVRMTVSAHVFLVYTSQAAAGVSKQRQMQTCGIMEFC